MSEQSTPFDAESYQATDPLLDEIESEVGPEDRPTDEAEIVAADEVEPPARASFFRPWMAVAGVALIFVIAGVWWQARERARIREWRWGQIKMPEDIARVPQEWSAKTLGERLEKSGKIHDAQTFREAAEEVNLQLVQPGAYPLPEKAGPRELAQLFNQSPPLIKVTFPEGWTAAHMARRLQSSGFVHAAQLRQAAYPPAQPVSPLEGKLFPDTYYLPREGRAEELIAPMTARYREVTAALPKPFPTGADGKPLSLAEVTILASIIERETSVTEERPLIAGVLLNRLRKGMRLQVDATVQYARERAAAQGQLPTGHKADLLWRDLKIASPYNTYKIKGLPPGPICNPGEATLKAAARPQASPYLFYVMSPKLGRHRFSKTFEEHQHNIRMAKQEK